MPVSRVPVSVVTCQSIFTFGYVQLQLFKMDLIIDDIPNTTKRYKHILVL